MDKDVESSNLGLVAISYCNSEGKEHECFYDKKAVEYDSHEELKEMVTTSVLNICKEESLDSREEFLENYTVKSRDRFGGGTTYGIQYLEDSLEDFRRAWSMVTGDYDTVFELWAEGTGVKKSYEEDGTAYVVDDEYLLLGIYRNGTAPDIISGEISRGYSLTSKVNELEETKKVSLKELADKRKSVSLEEVLSNRYTFVEVEKLADDAYQKAYDLGYTKANEEFEGMSDEEVKGLSPFDFDSSEEVKVEEPVTEESDLAEESGGSGNVDNTVYTQEEVDEILEGMRMEGFLDGFKKVQEEVWYIWKF